MQLQREPLTSLPKPVQGYGFCEANLVGSGSGALCRRSSVLSFGGFDQTLRSKLGEGTADWVFYLELAKLGTVVAVSDVTVGYRISDGSMSSDVDAMYRAYDAVQDTIDRLFPDRSADFSRARAKLLFAAALDQARQNRVVPATRYLFRSAAADWGMAVSRLGIVFGRLKRRVSGRIRHRMHLGRSARASDLEVRLPFLTYCDLLCVHDRREAD